MLGTVRVLTQILAFWLLIALKWNTRVYCLFLTPNVSSFSYTTRIWTGARGEIQSLRCLQITFTKPLS